MSLYVNRLRYGFGAPTIGVSSGIVNMGYYNGVGFYDDDYDPTPPAHDYSQDYFTIESLEDSNNIVFYHRSTAGGMYWSKNQTSWTYVNLAVNDLNVSLNTGDKLYLKGNGNATAFNQLYMPKQANIYGNIMSLIYGDNFVGQTTLPSANMFSGDGTVGIFQGSKVVDAGNLILPATTLTSSCYYQMFYNCTSLTTAPELPATTLARACYNYMFYGCTSLTEAPELPATSMTDYCYSGMFQNCTSLTAAPELPATTLADYCYSSMFRNCTSLTTAPELLATTLADYCCHQMFYNCTSLTTAPNLLASTLKSQCYYRMFMGCSNLNYIKCLATDISPFNCLQLWVYNVAATGTFVKDSSMSSWPDGASGIPSGWTVQNI